jgi:pimeloyl-ACP methyl ester carboxylesterase
MRRRAFRVAAVAALVFGLLGSGSAATAAPAPILDASTLNGVPYRIEIPANWNGTLALYSHGYVAPGSANPASDAGDPFTRLYLLSQGYALAGSAYRTTGWAVQDALIDQVVLLDYFTAHYGAPKRTIAWGHSLGGMITAGLIQQHPRRFSGALPMCGVLAGSVGVWNTALDAAFAFKMLVAPDSTLQLVHITDPAANLRQAEILLAAAQSTPQGRARIALMSAVGDVPGWFDPLSPEPATNDYAGREVNQAQWHALVDFSFAFAFRAEMEVRAGGNPSWNTGVDYRRQLRQSINRDEVEALYAAAGLSLDDDLETLARAPRVAAQPDAVAYLTRNIVYNGEVDVPVLTMHTTGDGLVLNQDEQAYARIFDERSLLRQTFVNRAGHCTFTPAETVAAFNALVRRLDTRQWSGISPAELNAAATALGPAANLLPPAYLSFTPTRFPRPFSLDGHDGHAGQD